MKSVHSFLAFASGFSTVALVAWLAGEVRAQNGGSGAIHVCAAEDGVLRLAQSTANCLPGEKSLFLLPVVQSEQRDTMDESLQPRIAALEQRVRDLENAATRGELGARVLEPFVVQNQAGKPIFSVSKRSGPDSGVKVSVNDSTGKTVTGIETTAQDAWFLVNSRAAERQTWLGVLGGYAGLDIKEGGTTRLAIARNKERGTYLLKAFGKGKALVAAIGQNSGGSGIVVVADDRGTMKARMYANGDDDTGKVVISKTNVDEVASLTEDETGGGLLRIVRSGDQPAVEAGVTAAHFGVVRTGPIMFKPGLGLLGLPGSYIAGKP